MLSRGRVWARHQIRHADKGPSANRSVGQFAKPAFHQMGPRGIGRREVEWETWVLLQPPLHARMFVGSLVKIGETGLRLRRLVQSFPGGPFSLLPGTEYPTPVLALAPRYVI